MCNPQHCNLHLKQVAHSYEPLQGLANISLDPDYRKEASLQQT